MLESVHSPVARPPQPAAEAYINHDGSIRGLILGAVAEVCKERDSKRLFYFVCIMATYTVIELVYAVRFNSLGLLSDAFHMSFHCLGMLASLAGMVLSRAPPSFAFSYGFDRYEVLASFTASTCLLFVCLFLGVQAFHRVLSTDEPDPSMATIHTLEFGIAGLVMNVAGLFMFGRSTRRFANPSLHGSSGTTTTAPGRGAASHHDLGAHQSNIQAVYLHVFSDAASSLAVIVSAILVRWAGWTSMDAVQSLAVAGFSMVSVVPLFNTTGKMLLQGRPSHLKAALDRCRREASAVDGVLECSDEHYWTQSPGVVVGTVCVRVRNGAAEQSILSTVHRIFSKHITHLTIQVEKDPPLDWLTAGDATSGPVSSSGSSVNPPSASSAASAATTAATAATMTAAGTRKDSGSAAVTSRVAAGGTGHHPSHGHAH